MRIPAAVMAGCLLAAAAQATETGADGPDQDEAQPVAPVSEETVRAGLKAKLEAESAEDFTLLGETIPPGERRLMRWRSPQSFGGFASLAPLTVINGSNPGPVLCFTGAVHGDELNGIEIARRMLQRLQASELRGVVVGMPIVNVEGFHRRDRYIGDRRDLNRFFPGKPEGSYASRVAYALFTDVIAYCDGLVDLHTGSFYRENLPQVRGDLSVPAVAVLADGFGGMSVLHDGGPVGSLRGAAVEAGIPAVVLEIGEALAVDVEQVETAVNGIFTMMRRVGMLPKRGLLLDPEPTFFHSEAIRSETGGIFINEVKLGDRVRAGDKLAEIIDPATSDTVEVISPHDGRVLGQARNQFVSPGFWLYRIGVERTLEEMEAVAKEDAEEQADDGKDPADM